MPALIMDQDREYWDWPLQENDGIVPVLNNDEKFEVGLEAKTFAPNEISVRVIGGLLEVHFERKKKKDEFGNVYRTITRSYRLPEDIDIRTLRSHLSSRGILNISAKKLH